MWKEQPRGKGKEQENMGTGRRRKQKFEKEWKPVELDSAEDNNGKSAREGRDPLL